MRRTLHLAVGAALLTGCGAPGEYETLGLGEPLVVHGARFVPGPLPEPGTGPAVDTIESKNTIATQGQAGKKIGGDVDVGSGAIAMRFDDVGSGYWTFPVGVPDPGTPYLTWNATFDIDRAAPLGTHSLQFVALAADGTHGPMNEVPMIIKSLVPEGTAVVALSWNSTADLDLHLLTPSGKDVSAKHPSTAVPAADGGVSPTPDDGTFDRDSNGGCAEDGFREEDVVWTGRPQGGRYYVFVDEFDSCGSSSTTFTVRVLVNGQSQLELSGRLSDLDASGGVVPEGQTAPPGLFVTQFDFPEP